MQIVLNFKRSTVLKAAATTGLILALAGAVGTAIAMSPIVQPPIKWQGGWEAGNSNFTGAIPIYKAPAGNNLLITDVIIGNFGNSQNAFGIYVGGGPVANICSFSNGIRLHQIPVPVGNTVALNLTTGIGFGAGTTVCVGGAGLHQVSLLGFLFKPAPAS